jgi:predicted O-methyltransferase YrrM
MRIKRYLKPKNYLKAVQYAIHRVSAKSVDEWIVDENQKFKVDGLDFRKGEEKLNQILLKEWGRRFDRTNDSIHWLLAACLSVKEDYKPKKILEFGTFTGEFTKILVELFPDSEITTIDLPEDDPILRSSYRREDKDSYKEFLAVQSKNLSKGKIRLLKTNSLFLPQYIPNETFDLIWVDGGHLYPEVSWDICFSFNYLNSGGFALYDDVITSHKPYRDKYVSTESFEVLEYLKDRIDSDITYFLKRLSSVAKPDLVKYVALLQKAD